MKKNERAFNFKQTKRQRVNDNNPVRSSRSMNNIERHSTDKTIGDTFGHNSLNAEIRTMSQF